MLTPFQRLLQFTIHGVTPRHVLLAAAGPSLRAFDSSTGQFLSKWSHLEVENSIREDSPGSWEQDESENRPAKKRKTENGNTSETPSAEIVIDNDSKRRRPPRRGITVPCITHMLSTTDGKHVVLVTGEDKSIRVLSMSEKGTLHQLSQRLLPKRPSAMALTPDENTILCSDKFGDVYSLPLLGLPFEATKEEKTEDPAPEEMFKTAASSKTVHTKRNLRALESQQKQKKEKRKPKLEFMFEHELLLGHVSLLTDIVCVKVKADGAGGRTYILTSDRDEHIRVSRGIPQAHIIENFCLGHEQFISKLYIPAWHTDTLISAGGDDYMLLWQWRQGVIRQKINMKEHFLAQRSVHTNSASVSIAVSGIWSMQTGNGGQIIVACEAVPALLFFKMSLDGAVDERPYFQADLPYNVLDVAIRSHEQAIVVSLDNAHAPWTTRDGTSDNEKPSLIKFKLDDSASKWVQIEDACIQQINDVAKNTTEAAGESLDSSTLGEIFYNIEHLRKRGAAEEQEEDV